MCRIAGIIDYGSKTIQQDILFMRDAMHRGGPDQYGVFCPIDSPVALAHRRLSIIDLSDAAKQPMEDAESKLVISFNGEIYNYLILKEDLKDKGFKFKTNSDTEVILYAYKYWGKYCFSRFIGMFAIAIYDIQNKHLLLARDHAGIKPLYYYLKSDQLYFASEMRAFGVLKNKFVENANWKAYFLMFGYLPEPITTLKDVYTLKSGTCMIVNTANFSSEIYSFHKEEYSCQITKQDEAIHLVKQQLHNAVKRHLIADAPLAVFLSGGLDSSILSHLAKNIYGNELITIAMNFKEYEYSEAYYQQLLVRKLKTKHQSFVLSQKEFMDGIDDVFNAMDQPTTDGMNTYFICKYAKSLGVKVVLSGIGADEVFGGYPSFSKSRKWNHIDRVIFNAIARLSSNYKHKKMAFASRNDIIGDYLISRAYFSIPEIKAILNDNSNSLNALLDAIMAPSELGNYNLAQRISFMESNYYMKGQLLKDADMMGMWHGVEIRVPFLDSELLTNLKTIKPNLLFMQKVPKQLLMNAFKNDLPAEIYERKKMGFLLPFANWMKSPDLQSKYTFPNANLAAQFNAGKTNWSRYWSNIVMHNFKNLHTV